MSRVTISILLLLSAMVLHVLGVAQCPTDPSYFQWYNKDTLNLDTVQCLPTKCGETTLGGWQLPSGLIGIVEVGAITDGTYRVMVVNSCDTVRLDTCVYLSEGLAFRLVMRYDFLTNSQLYVFGQSGAVIVMEMEHDTAGPLPHPILLLDTLCPTSIHLPATQCESYNHTSILTLHEYPNSQPIDLPAGLYWQWCHDRRMGKKIIIQH